MVYIISAVHKPGHLSSELGNPQILFNSWFKWRAIPFTHTWPIVFSSVSFLMIFPMRKILSIWKKKFFFITILHFKRCKVIESELWKSLFQNIYSSCCIQVFCPHVCQHTTHIHGLQKSEEGVRFPGSGVAHGCELSLGSLKEHHQMPPLLYNRYHHTHHDLDRAFHT